MTKGQLMFYGGIALLLFTVILAIVFFIKKPVYRPESGAIRPPEDTDTQRLRNGFPTSPITVRRDSVSDQQLNETQPLSEEMEPASRTEYLQEGTSQTEYLPEDHT